MGSAVGASTDVHDSGGGVGLGAGLGLADSVLLCFLQSHGESSLGTLGGLLLSDVDSESVGGLLGVVSSIHGEGRITPVLAHELGLVAVEPLSQAPNNFW